MKARPILLLAVFALCAFSAGCASVYDVDAAMKRGGYRQVLVDTQNVDTFPERDKTLILNYRAHAKMALGYHRSARDDYLLAWNIMNHGKGGGVASAYFFSERQKHWMGDPFERMMNSYYLGMLYFQAGKPEDAIACFKNALFVDTGDLEAGEYAADFIPVFIMRSRCFLSRGDDASVNDMLKEVNALDPNPANFDPNCPYFTLEAQKEANVLVFLELGKGPFFTAEGHHGSQRATNQSFYRESFARIWIDGQPMGDAYKIGDLFFQAITRGGRVMDDILQGKAIAKTAGIAAGAAAVAVGAELARHGNGTAGAITAGVGAAVLLASLLISAEADVRCNKLLPGEIHLLMAKVPAGKHSMEVRFYDKNNLEMRDLRQQNLELDVKETGDTVVQVRSQPRYRVPNEVNGESDPYAAKAPAASASGK